VKYDTSTVRWRMANDRFKRRFIRSFELNAVSQRLFELWISLWITFDTLKLNAAKLFAALSTAFLNFLNSFIHSISTDLCACG
jgi:hypothetical protein